MANFFKVLKAGAAGFVEGIAEGDDADNRPPLDLSAIKDID